MQLGIFRCQGVYLADQPGYSVLVRGNKERQEIDINTDGCDEEYGYNAVSFRWVITSALFPEYSSIRLYLVSV